MSNLMAWFPWILGGMFASLVITSSGCVSPESAKKIERLEKVIADAAAKHQKGELTTKETESIVRAAVDEMKEVNETEKWYNMLGAAAIVAAMRFLGIPGLASSSGINAVSLLRGMVTKKK